MAATISKYGVEWPANANELQIELACIRKGIGLSRSYHYERVRKMLWPELDSHRWHELCRDTILANKLTVLMGAGSTGKTHSAAWIYLVEYLSNPNETCVLVSSTDIRSLKMRVWGEMVTLWQKAIDRYDWLPGHLLDSSIAIVTDDIEDKDIDERKSRDMRKGIIGVPCIVGNKTVALSKFIGIKQKHMRLIGDELAAMPASYLSAFSNLNNNEDFRAIVLGNPSDPLDPLGIAAEPVDGWDAHMEPTKTSVWSTRFMNGMCVNLVGTDSPNFDFPATQPTRYKYLVSREKIAETVSAFGKDSFEYYSQCLGVMKVSQLSKRIITRDLCRQFGAMEDDNWAGDERIKIAAVDAAYGGDRCVGGHIEFGRNVEGKMILKFYQPQIIPVRVRDGEMPEDQIADWVKKYCETHSISPENFFHDSTGRGGLGTAIARVWSAQTNPVEFGGAPTKRPVSQDFYVYDSKTHQRRLKLCNEHYDRFVSELWYSMRYAIEAGQIRSLPQDVMNELCMREFERIKGDKIKIETKDEMKERLRRSPDFGDWAAICVEGARRRGFQISKLANVETESNKLEWLKKLNAQHQGVDRKHELNYEAS